MGTGSSGTEARQLFVTSPVDVARTCQRGLAIATGGTTPVRSRPAAGSSAGATTTAAISVTDRQRRSPCRPPSTLRGSQAGRLRFGAGGLHSCALLGTGGVKCWGSDAYGQLGDAFSNGYRRNAATPVSVVGLPVRQTIVLRPSKPAGTIARGSVVTFTATIKPVQPAGARATVRFEVYHKVAVCWKLASGRNVAASAAGLATFRWAFSAAGSWTSGARRSTTPRRGQYVESQGQLHGALTLPTQGTGRLVRHRSRNSRRLPRPARGPTIRLRGAALLCPLPTSRRRCPRYPRVRGNVLAGLYG